MIIEYKTDGSFREFRNYLIRRTKEDLVRELWQTQGEIHKFRQAKRDTCTLECGAYTWAEMDIIFDTKMIGGEF